METITVAGLFIFVFITEHPVISAVVCGALLWRLCRIDGGATPLFAFALYCAITGAVYAIGASLIRPAYLPGLGGLIPLGIMTALFPLIFGGLWWWLKRFRARRWQRSPKNREDKQNTL